MAEHATADTSSQNGSTGRDAPSGRWAYCPCCGRWDRGQPTRRRYNNRWQVFVGGRFVNEEILVVESILGGPLPPRSKVRHINHFAPNDNRLENLFLELPGEPTLYHRRNWRLSQCATCDGDYFIDPVNETRLKCQRRILFCSPWCYYEGRPPPHNASDRVRAPKSPRKGPDPDRWRAWSPQVAALARMVPDPDPGPGSPNRYPLIVIPDPPDDLPYWGPRVTEE